MVKLKKLLSIIVLGAMIMTNAVPVSAAEAGNNEKINSLSEIDLGEYEQYLIDDEEQVTDKTRVAAPPLTSFKLYAINSEKAGIEYISTSSSFAQVGSTLDHGGTWFQAVTIETGYAKTRYAYFNNIRMTLTGTEGFDVDGDRVIDGYFCVWTYEGNSYEAGTFTANSTSANSPWNTMNMTFYVH
ncbi:MAG: DUF4879 domain-containing protein [Lachnospiraceae bacterium]|nr:DUF4879 domain-containing protein [Lachnospiraceae bacterium]